MPYKPTGKPPGRPRKNALPDVPTAPAVEPSRGLTRAHKHFRNAAENVGASLHQPPRHKREPGARRAMLHPNVVARNG